MTIKKLEKTDWSSYFDALSRMLQHARAEIDAVALSVGSQVQTNWAPLTGVTYDARDDIVEITMEGLDHLIHTPSDIYVDEDAGRIGSMEIISRDQGAQIVKFKDPVDAPTWPSH